MVKGVAPLAASYTKIHYSHNITNLSGRRQIPAQKKTHIKKKHFEKNHLLRTQQLSIQCEYSPAHVCGQLSRREWISIVRKFERSWSSRMFQNGRWNNTPEIKKNANTNSDVYDVQVETGTGMDSWKNF